MAKRIMKFNYKGMKINYKGLIGALPGTCRSQNVSRIERTALVPKINFDDFQYAGQRTLYHATIRDMNTASSFHFFFTKGRYQDRVIALDHFLFLKGKIK